MSNYDSTTGARTTGAQLYTDLWLRRLFSTLLWYWELRRRERIAQVALRGEEVKE